jgi:hypothetical protein
MTDSVNRASKAGSFLTGKPNWVSIATTVPVAQTNVTTPVRDLPGYQTWATLGIWTTVTVIDGDGMSQDYTNVGDYRVAYFDQLNLNTLISTVGSRSNVTQVSVKQLPASINGTAINPRSSVFFADAGYHDMAGNTVFGSDFNSTSRQVYIVDVALEHDHVWGAYNFSNYGTSTPMETNDDGYQLGVAINGLKAYPEDQNNVPSSDAGTSDPYYYSMGYDINDTDGPAVAFWDVSGNSAGTNVLYLVGSTLPGSLVA